MDVGAPQYIQVMLQTTQAKKTVHNHPQYDPSDSDANVIIIPFSLSTHLPSPLEFHDSSHPFHP